MRIKVSMRAETAGFLFPYNYKYQLQSALYSVIAKSSVTYSSMLHDSYQKFVTHSDLVFRRYNAEKNGIFVKSKIAYWFISTPVDDIANHIITGISTINNINLDFGHQSTNFSISAINILPEIDFSNTMKFKCISPIYVSAAKQKTDSSRTKHYYVDYFENPQDFGRLLKSNLTKKYTAIYNKQAPNAQFHFDFDDIYIKQRKRISSLVALKDRKVICWKAPFVIKTDPELIKVGYECGFGGRNISGFGMVEEV